MAASTEHWSLDRRIPLAVIAALGTQAIGLIVTGTLLWSDVEDHARRIAKLEDKQIADDARQAEIHVAVVRLQEATLALRDVTTELRAEVRQLREAAGRRAEVIVPGAPMATK